MPSKVINLTINSFLNRTVESEIIYHISRALIEHLDDEPLTGDAITTTTLKITNDVELEFQRKEGVLVACYFRNWDILSFGCLKYTDTPTLLRDLDRYAHLSGRVGWNTEQEAALMSVDM